jgi:phage shock protein C
MFCTKCGVELEERDHFCYRCGALTVRGQSPYVQRRLVRSVTNKKIAGVCGGLADYLDTDPVMMRLLWVLLTLGLPPAGIIGYIIAWIVIPKAPTVPVEFNPAPVPQS